MSFLDHTIAIIIIWLTVTAQPDNNMIEARDNSLLILTRDQNEIQKTVDSFQKLILSS